MKRLVMTSAMMITMFGLAGEALAVRPVKRFAGNPPVDNPFVNITTKPDKLNLGISRFPGAYESASELTVNVDSNYMYGSIVASISPLKRSGGGSIAPESIFIMGPATNGYVTMKKPVPVSKSARGSNKIALNFKVETDFKDPAGRYEGVLIFTIAPPS